MTVDPAVLALYQGLERLQVEQALTEERLTRRRHWLRRHREPARPVVPAPRRPQEP